MNNQFSIFNVNIRSCRANFDSFRHYTDELKQKFLIFTLTESWLKDYNKNLYNLKGYKYIFKLRENKFHGGDSMYIKVNITYQERESLSLDPGACPLEIEKQKKKRKRSSEQILSYFTFILLLF